MIKITAIKQKSPWYEDRKHFIGETFRLEGSRYYPETDKAKRYAQEQGVEYFVFIDGAETLPA